MQEKKKKLTGQQGELMRALDITMDDLIANDEGYISEEQRHSVLKRQSYQYIPAFFMSALFAGLGIFIPLVVFLAGKTEKLNTVFILSLFFLLLAAGASGIGIWLRQRLKNELEHNSIQTTQGIAVVNTTLGESLLEINGLNLHARPEVLRRVQHLQPYLIHYLPESKVILSMEHITDDNNIREDAAQSRLRDNTIQDAYIPDEENFDNVESSSL